jgi:hypothetical protein
MISLVRFRGVIGGLGLLWSELLEESVRRNGWGRCDWNLGLEICGSN